MQVILCPFDSTPLVVVQSKNLFIKHAGCWRCRRLFAMWGDRITLCDTPHRCACWPWIAVATGIPVLSVIQGGPHGMGLL